MIEKPIDREQKLRAACSVLIEACQLASTHVPWDVAVAMDLAMAKAEEHMGQGCSQRGCRMAVAQANLIKSAARITNDGGLHAFLMDGLARITADDMAEQAIKDGNISEVRDQLDVRENQEE